MSALEKPLLTKLLKTAIKTTISPINPYSSGVRSLANTNPTKKVMPVLAMLSAKLQLTPVLVFSSNVFSDTL
jgi:hypothetical protein